MFDNWCWLAQAVGGCNSVFRTEHKIATRRWTVQAALPGLSTRPPVRNMGKAPPCNSNFETWFKPMFDNWCWIAQAGGGCNSVFRTEHKIGPRRWTVQATLPGFATRGSVRNMGKVPPCYPISKQGLRRSVTTNQLSLLRDAIARVTQLRQHLVGRPLGVGLMPCAFASLRLCALKASVSTQRRKDAERTWPRGG